MLLGKYWGGEDLVLAPTGGIVVVDAGGWRNLEELRKGCRSDFSRDIHIIQGFTFFVQSRQVFRSGWEHVNIGVRTRAHVFFFRRHTHIYSTPTSRQGRGGLAPPPPLRLYNMYVQLRPGDG